MSRGNWNTTAHRNYINGHKPWWNDEINKLKKLTKKIHRKIEKIIIKNPMFHESMPKFNRLVNEYKSASSFKIQNIRKAKTKYNKNINNIYQNTTLNDET